MAESYDLVIRGGTLVSHDGVGAADVGIRDGRFAAIGDIPAGAGGEEIDAGGLHVFPGVIDTQVHFREPGNEHKEDLEAGSRGAVLGGVTAVFEMPNTSPATTDPAALQDKLDRARDRMWCEHAFYVGATQENADRLAELERLPGCCGVKIFMGSSTGDLLTPDDDGLRRVLRSGRRRCAVHAEDEPRLIERRHLAEEAADPAAHPVWRNAETALRATRRLVALARETARPIHVLHITTADEISFLAAQKDIASVEVTPQHLTLEAPGCYQALGTLAQMNPPIRDSGHRAGLWQGLQQGVVDVIGSDHAPHTREEKGWPYPQSPSGMPGVQTLVPLLLDHVHHGRLSLPRFMDLTSAGAVRLFGLVGKGRVAVGYDADLTLADLAAEREITDEMMANRAGWTPFAGRRVTGWPMATLIRGRVVMRDGALCGTAQGRPLRFLDTLRAAG